MSARVLLTTLVTAAVCLAAAAPSAAASKPCGKVSLGFTSAKIRGQGMSCPAAREVFRAWRSTVSQDDGPAPRRVRVGPFTCRFGGSEITLRLRCRDGGKVMRARWGG